jgi:nucleotide-binding universal stress UspA family protein
MPKHRLFVVPVDFSREMEAAVAAAFALAKRWDAEVHLLEVVPQRGPSLLADHANLRLEYGATSRNDWSRLEQSLNTAERGGTRVRAFTFRGVTTKVIASYAQLKKATLLVVGKHYGTPRWNRNARLVGSLSRAAPAPVLVLPPQHRSEKNKSLAFGQIVSAIDFTVASAVATRTVLDLVRRTGAQVTLVHALKASHPTVYSGSAALRVVRNLQAQAAQVAERLRRKIPADVRLRTDARVTTGDPYRAILRIASEVKADLIVMGVPPRSRFDEVLFGSTLRNVLRRTKIPLLVLPVLTGAYKWLQETDGVEIAVTPRIPARPKQLRARS